MRWLDGITNLMELSVGRLWEIVKDREHWHAVVQGATKSQTEQQPNTVPPFCDFLFPSSQFHIFILLDFTSMEIYNGKKKICYDMPKASKSPLGIFQVLVY